MNDREFRNRLNQDLPDAPEIFHRAMTDTLKTIVREEGKRRASSARLTAASVESTESRRFSSWVMNGAPVRYGVAADYTIASPLALC